MKEITAIWTPVSYISSLWCILLGSCCFNLWASPCGCFHMVAWLTMRAGRIIRPVAANKSLLLSDPVSVCSMARSPECLCACVFIYRVCRNVCVCVRVTPGYLFQKRKWNPLCAFSLPHSEPFLFIISPALPSAPIQQLTCKISLMDISAEWLLLLSTPQKLQQLSAIETFTFIFLKKKWMWMRGFSSGVA